jgi:hypothetical protein
MWALLLLAAITIKAGDTPIRDGCDEYDSTLVKAPAGTPVEIRFAMNGFPKQCFKVSAQLNGKEWTGYVWAEALDGVESFDEQRRAAPALTITNQVQQQAAAIAGSVTGAPDHPLVKASNLLQERQPRAALEIAEQTMKRTGRDRQFLLIAGIASYQLDNAREALAYLREAQQFGEDRAIAMLIARLEKEVGGDKSSEKLYGNRFLLRYEGGNLETDVARNMVTVLEEEYGRISAALGCRTDDRISVIIQSREAYRASTDVAEWSGGLFDGSRIRVPVLERGGISQQTRQTFAHEITHACLASLGNWPAWLHEGLAQKMSGETLHPARRTLVIAALKAGKLPKISNMGQSFARMSGEHAALAYGYSYVAVEALLERYRDFGIQNLLRMPERLPGVAEDVDRFLASGR